MTARERRNRSVNTLSALWVLFAGACVAQTADTTEELKQTEKQAWVPSTTILYEKAGGRLPLFEEFHRDIQKEPAKSEEGIVLRKRVRVEGTDTPTFFAERVPNGGKPFQRLKVYLANSYTIHATTHVYWGRALNSKTPSLNNKDVFIAPLNDMHVRPVHNRKFYPQRGQVLHGSCPRNEFAVWAGEAQAGCVPFGARLALTNRDCAQNSPAGTCVRSCVVITAPRSPRMNELVGMRDGYSGGKLHYLSVRLKNQ